MKKNSILIDLKEKDVSKYERYGANSFPTTEEPKLSVVFEPWDDDNNGVYLGDEMVVNIQHESLGEWFRILPYKLTTGFQFPLASNNRQTKITKSMATEVAGVEEAEKEAQEELHQ